jgi:hypothetical protein
MSKKVFATLSLMTLLVAAPMFAEGPLKATIPFDFRVGNTLMTAGDYTVSFTMPSVAVISREDGKANCAIITMATTSPKPSEVGKLVFNRYGNSHFLSQIWSPGYAQGRLLGKSKTEVEYAKNAGGAQLATVRAAGR